MEKFKLRGYRLENVRFLIKFRTKEIKTPKTSRNFFTDLTVYFLTGEFQYQSLFPFPKWRHRMYIMAEFSTALYIGSRLRNGRIFPNTGKYGPEKTPYLDTFYAVIPFFSIH